MLPPPAASRVYELTDYGRELRPVMRELALWGARSLGPPTAGDELFPGWLANALDTVLAPLAPPGRFEFRVGEEVASLVDGEALAGAVEHPDVVVEGDPEGVYYLFIERRSTACASRATGSSSSSCSTSAPAPVELTSAA